MIQTKSIKCERVCAICGNRFMPKGNNSKYCSLECREVATQRNKKNWVNSRPGYITEYMREYRARKKVSSEKLNI